MFLFLIIFFEVCLFCGRDGNCECILQQCLHRVCNLAILVEATEQDVNFIGFVISFFLSSFLSAISRFWWVFFLLFRFFDACL